MVPLRRMYPAAFALVAALILGGCAMDGPQVTVGPKLAGEVARIQYDIFLVTIFVSVCIFLTVGSAMVYAVFRFRHRGPVTPSTPLPPQVHGNVPLEIGLTCISIALVAIIAVATVAGIARTENLPPGAEGHSETITVEGWQWWWNFKYDEYGFATSNEMAIPVGRPVVVNLRTRDVIHAFWVPRLAGKMDLVPNQDNRMWFQADRPGIYWGQCTEYCGESHAFMRFRVLALEEADYQKWVKAQQQGDEPPQEGSLAAKGQQVFFKRCVACHAIRGTPARGMRGPDLTHFASRTTLAAGLVENNPENLRRWLTENYEIKPGNRMYPDPNVQAMMASPEEVDALVAYLSSLRSEEIDGLVESLKAKEQE